MDLKIVICGVGGQGVLYLAKNLYALATDAGSPVLGSETHGMSQRGGSVTSHVKMGPYASPMVERGTADLLLSLKAEETLPHLPFLREGGRLVVNAPAAFRLPAEVSELLDARGVAVHLFDAGSRAVDIGSPASANLVLLAHCISAGILSFSAGDAERAVRAVTAPRRLDGALAAFEAGSG